jgi:hypothetical protein
MIIPTVETDDIKAEFFVSPAPQLNTTWKNAKACCGKRAKKKFATAMEKTTERTLGQPLLFPTKRKFNEANRLAREANRSGDWRAFNESD